MLPDTLAQIEQAVTSAPDPMQAIERMRSLLHQLSPQKDMPVDHVRWVPVAKVRANDYNPNSVAHTELRLLYTSIAHDGYTQPVVTIHDAASDTYTIVDGFHRYYVMRNSPDILERCHGLLPVVVIDKGINDRMASTVRHNRARGKHSVDGMANMVYSMLDEGWSDADICNELGMEAEELVRIKHITGFSKLFADAQYRNAWAARNQVVIKHKYAQDHPDETLPEDVL